MQRQQPIFSPQQPIFSPQQKERYDQLLEDKKKLIRDNSELLALLLIVSLYYFVVYIIEMLSSFNEKMLMKNYEANKKIQYEEIEKIRIEVSEEIRNIEDSKSKIYKESEKIASLKLETQEMERHLTQILKTTPSDQHIHIKRMLSELAKSYSDHEKAKSDKIRENDQRIQNLKKLEKNLNIKDENMTIYTESVNKYLAELKNYYKIAEYFFSFFPLMKNYMHGLTGRYYQHYFFPDPQCKEPQAFINSLDKQVQNLKKISERNKKLARLLSVFLIPISTYQIITNTDFNSPEDVTELGKFIPLFFTTGMLLKIAMRDFRKDFDWSEETRQKNEIIKAKDILNQTLRNTQTKYNLSLTVQESNLKKPDSDETVKDSSDKPVKCISLIFNNKNLKRSALVKQIATLFQSNNINCVDRGSNYISFSQKSLISLTPEKINSLNQELEKITTRTFETGKILQQIDKLQQHINEKLKLNDFKIVTQPEYDENGLRVFHVYIEKITNNNAFNEKLLRILKLFPNNKVITNNNERIELRISSPANEKFESFVNNLNLSNTPNESRHVPPEYRENYQGQHRKKTPRNVTKTNKEKQQQEAEKERRANEKSKSKSQNNVSEKKKDKGEFIRGRGIPAGVFRLVNNLKPRDFNNNEALYEHVCNKLKEAHMAGARKGANGFLFIDPTRKSYDNGRRFEANGKYKLKGTEFGDVSIYCWTDKDKPTTYHAAGVILKHSKQRHNKI